MLWSEVLSNWEKGIVPKYPLQLKNKFQWNTSVLKNNGNTPFRQTFRTNDDLPIKQNTKEFKEHFLNKKNVVSFPNLNKDTMLVVPVPVRGKNYATIRDFADNAPETQQQEFWKEVARTAKKCMKEKGAVWISVHGLGVALYGFQIVRNIISRTT
jgi:hypothetical protein